MGKPKMGPYALFVHEQKQLQRGWHKKSPQEIFKLADPLWRGLSEEERNSYVLKAKGLKEDSSFAAKALEVNNNHGVTNSKGFDSLGRSLDDLRKRDIDAVRTANEKCATVKEMIENDDDLENRAFVIMHVNIFVHVPEKNAYVPAEIALTKFSIHKGIIDTYQAFPRPGRIPPGYKYACIETSEQKHKIPLGYEPVSKNPDDTYITEFMYTEDSKIINDIKDMLKGIRYIFTMPDIEDRCRGVLRQMTTRSKLEDLDIQILHLNELLYRLMEEEYIPGPLVAMAQFEREWFLYHSGLCCPWHEDNTDTVHCSESLVKRWTYTILHFTTNKFETDIIDGQHVPRGTQNQEIEASHLIWETTNERKPHREFKYGENGFPSSDIRYRGQSYTEDEEEVTSLTDTMASSSISHISDLDSESGIVTTGMSSTIGSIPASSRSSVSSLSGSKPGNQMLATLRSQRNSRMAANLNG